MEIHGVHCSECPGFAQCKMSIEPMHTAACVYGERPPAMHGRAVTTVPPLLILLLVSSGTDSSKAVGRGRGGSVCTKRGELSGYDQMLGRWIGFV